MLKQLICATALAVTTTAAFATPPDAHLQASLEAVAAQARPGTLGIMVLDPATHQHVTVNGSSGYLLMSVFKAPIAAAVLSRVDAGTLSLDRKVHLTPADIVDGSAVPSLGVALAKGPKDVTIDELLHASVTQSDNTAVDALLRVLGGGTQATRFLVDKGVRGIRIDMGERELGKMFEDKGSAAVLASGVNSATLDGAADFLQQLQAGSLLSPASTKKLLGLMNAQTTPSRLRAGLPAGYTIADKTGTGGSEAGRRSAFNDIAIITAPSGQQRIVVVFLENGPADMTEPTKWFANIAHIVASSM